MTERHTWQDANEAWSWLRGSPGDRRTLLLVATLPLVNASILAQLFGLQGRASVYRSLQRLGAAGLVTAMKPAPYPEPPSRQYVLTDLGLAVVALDHGVEPASLARHCHLRHVDLLRLTPRLPEVLASYELLAALAAAGPGWPRLLHWERPWRRRYWPATTKAPVSVTLPAHAILSWGEHTRSFLLVPDLGTVPLRLYRPALHRLLGLRQQSGDFPYLVVATSGRAAAWEDLLEEVRRAWWEAGWAAVIATWEQLSTDLQQLVEMGACDRPVPRDSAGPPALQPLRARRLTSPLPRLVGNVTAAESATTATSGLGQVALAVTPCEYALLDLVAHHPFLTPPRLATVLGWTVSRVRRRLRRLTAMELLRLVGEDEIGDAHSELVEATGPGLELIAARLGLTLPIAIRELGLAGGGPNEPLGSRAQLLKELAHTAGADGIVVSLYGVARRLSMAGSDDAVLAWQNARACSRRHLRPDGYGMYRRDGTVYGFFLEYDRSTMRRHGYAAKLDAYYDYAVTRRYEREYSGYPTILVVTTRNATEELIAQIVQVASKRHGFPLPLLLTCTWRLEDRRNPHGLLGPIWREPGAPGDKRGLWLPPATCSGGRNTTTPATRRTTDGNRTDTR